MVGSRDDAHGIESGIHQLDQVHRLLRHPVGPGEAEIPAAGIEHLDDVLRLEDLRLEFRERKGRAVAAPVVGQTDAGVTQELDDGLLHAPLGQGQMNDD